VKIAPIIAFFISAEGTGQNAPCSLGFAFDTSLLSTPSCAIKVIEEVTDPLNLSRANCD